MNYYSTNIIKEIVDTEEECNIIEKITKLREDTLVLLMYYSRETVSNLYLKNMINDNNVKFVYRCMDTSQFRISNCPSVMSYVSNRTTNIITYYILFICTKRNYQKLGYATGLLLDFIKDEKMKNEKRNYKTKIILSSLETAVTYYEKIGFRWTRECLSAYPVLCKYEKFEKGKEYFIMECVP